MNLLRNLSTLLMAATAAGVMGQSPIARDQILETSNEHLMLRWYCSPSSIYTGITNASCPFTTTGWKNGIPYDWGGYDSRDSYWTNVVVNGGYAGDTNSGDIISNNYGNDCSGFVSRTLRSGRYTTSSFPGICTEITYPVIGPGDLMNNASSHVRLFEKYTGTNLTQEVECTTGGSGTAGMKRRIISTDSNYKPLRYNNTAAWPSLTKVLGGAMGSASVEFLGQSTSGFRVYHSTDAVNWSLVAGEGTLGVQAQTASANGLTQGDTHYFKSTAVNGGVETAASTVLALRQQTGARKALIVNAYDRWHTKTESGGVPHTFVTRTAQALAAAGYAFDSVDNLRVLDQTVSLANYSSVWWILGDESTTDEAFSYQEQLRLQDYLQGGGHLFVSGSEIFWDLINKKGPINDEAFALNYLKCGYVSDGSAGNGYSFSGITGEVCAGVSGNFDNGSSGTFDVTYPDVLVPQPGARSVMRYGTGGVAAVTYDGVFGSGTTPGSVFVMSFPLETITSSAARTAIVNAVTTQFFGVSAVEKWAQY